MTLKQMLQHPRVSGVMQAFALICCLLGARPLAAQTFYVCSGNNTTTTSQLDFTDGSLQTSAIDSITIDVPAGQRFVGGDISLLPTYEEHGAKYFDQQGQALDNVLAFVKEQGWNAARVRLFVDPSKASATDRGQGVRQDLDYVAALGRRIKEAGMLFMLDFHYSDSWADPAKQWTPAAWLALTDEQLATQLYDYTRECLQRMNTEGASPDFIQTGNEISYGMLWGTQANANDGKTNRCFSTSAQTNWDRFFALGGKNEDGNLAYAGKALLENTRGTIVATAKEGKLIALSGLRDYLVVDTNDVLLICPRDARSIKEITSRIAMPEFEKYR